MRCAQRQRTPALALVPILVLGSSLASVKASTEVWTSGVAQQQAAVVSPAYVDPYFWGAYAYAGFGFGVTYSYGPSPDGAHVQGPPRGAVPIELHVIPRKATLVVDGTSVGQARDFHSVFPA